MSPILKVTSFQHVYNKNRRCDSTNRRPTHAIFQIAYSTTISIKQNRATCLQHHDVIFSHVQSMNFSSLFYGKQVSGTV